MGVDCDKFASVFIILNACVGFSFLAYQGGLWAYNAISGDAPEQTDQHGERAAKEDNAAPPPNLDYKIYKKEGEESSSQGEHVLHGENDEDAYPLPPRPEDSVRIEKSDDEEDDTDTRSKDEGIMTMMVVDAVWKRLTERLERGEISLAPSSYADATLGGKNVTSHVTQVTKVTQVTNVTRFQYQCLVDDKIRWGVLEEEVKRATATEVDSKVARARAETGTLLAALNSTVEGTAVALALQEKRTLELEQRLRELDRRMALVPEFMEIQGFMKIDTFGPLLLAFGTLGILMAMCLCHLCAKAITSS